MNRTERRRQAKQSLSSPPLPPELKQMLREAVTHHQARRFQQAEQLYAHILSHHPTHPDSLHLLGVAAYQQGQYGRASDLISQAIQLNSDNPHYCFNLGLVMEKEGRWDDAVSAYQQALHLNPSYLEAQSNLGTVFRIQRKWEKAVEALQVVIRLNPSSADAHNNLGVVFKEMGNLEAAMGEYQTALQLNTSHAEAYNNLGVVQQEQRRLSEALLSFQQALTHKPHYANAHYHLGLTLLWQQRADDAVGSMQQSADLNHNHGRPVHLSTVSAARVKHDCEQIQYLQDHQLLSDIPDTYRETLHALYRQTQTDLSLDHRFSLTADQATSLAPSFNRMVYRAKAAALPDGAVNPQLDVPAIEAQFHAKKPEVLYVDHLLTEKALERLRQFCLESTIWKREYQNGYMGAFLAEGFACPLILQIAEELRTRFSGIFTHHLLTQAWAFKYDSTLRGLNLHADAAAINVNFWITPDEANLDPASGGLVVWDKEAPDEWDFKEYNNDNNKHKILDFLTQNHANAITIPYRQNRAVIFNSNLFHETDTLVFKKTYESRRINVTLLYGARQKASRPSS